MIHLRADEAERTVVGALLANGDLVDQVRGVLAPQHLVDPKLRAVLRAVLDVADRGETVDLVAVKGELGPALADLGGPAWLAGLVDGLPRQENVGAWVRQVKGAAHRRAILAEADRLRETAADPELATADVLEQHRAALERLTFGDDSLVPMSAVVKEALRNLDAFATEGRIPGVPTGIADLDVLLNGLQRGALIIAGGRVGRGKTVLLSQTAVSAAAAGYRVVAFPLEMPPPAVVERLLLAGAELQRSDLRLRAFEADHARAALARAAGRLAPLPILWDRTEAPTLGQIRARAKAAKSNGGLGLVVVDYLQRIKTEAKVDRWVAVGQLARGLKSLARELDVPVLVAAQLGRDAEGRRPTLADLRESGDLEQEADVVLLLDGPAEADEAEPITPTSLIVAKNRTGPTRTLTVGFRRSVAQFVAVAHGEA